MKRLNIKTITIPLLIVFIGGCLLVNITNFETKLDSIINRQEMMLQHQENIINRQEKMLQHQESIINRQEDIFDMLGDVPV